jgi:threonine/homoserine/homoserine lactone efflux protein
MTTGRAVAFLLFALAAAGTPGPANVILSATGAQVGITRGLPCLLGQTTGMGVMLFVVLAGLGGVVLGHPEVLAALHWAGAAVLLWLSWKIASASARLEQPGAKPVGYLGAALFQWVNPKAWLVIAGAAGTFLKAAGGGAVAQAAFLGVLFVSAALPVCFLWLAFGAGVQRLLRTPRRLRLFNIGMALLLALSILILVRGE